MWKRGLESDSPTVGGGVPSLVQIKKARRDNPGVFVGAAGGRGGGDRPTTSYYPSNGRENRDGDLNEEEEAEGIHTDAGLFSWEEQAEEETITKAIFSADDAAAVKKLSEAKEHLADLCRNYLAQYKTSGADVQFASVLSCTDSHLGLSSFPEEGKPEERNAGRAAAPFYSAAAGPSKCEPPPPPFEERNAGWAVFPPQVRRSISPQHQQPPELRRGPPGFEVQNAGRRAATFSSPAGPSKTQAPPPEERKAGRANPQKLHPPPECRRMPSGFDSFLNSDVLQLEINPHNSTACQDELTALDARALRVLDTLHQSAWGECDRTAICTAGGAKIPQPVGDLCQFRSYQFAFRAAAAAEILNVKSDLSKWRMELEESLSDDDDPTLGHGLAGVRARCELVKRLKAENESAHSELAQLRKDKKVTDESLKEAQTLVLNLEDQIASCKCKYVGPERKGVTKAEVLEPKAQQHEQQQAGLDFPTRVKAMRGSQARAFSDEERRLEGICEAEVEQEVFRLVVDKLDALKAEMGVFVQILQSRVASVAGKISRNESRVRPVKVGLFCLKLLIEKLQAKKAEIEASLNENSLDNATRIPDNRLGLKLHFRS